MARTDGSPVIGSEGVAPAAVATTCPYCGVGCGILATPDGVGGVAIKGDPSHPANYGRLCSKGAALGETVDLDDRILTPEIAEPGGLRRAAGWDEALLLVADRFTRAIREHGPDSVAFYVSGQILTEDYYVANKLMKGFIGGGNIDTNSRLCMSSAVAGHKRAFGEDVVPGCYEDLELADLVVLVGSNAAWCHPVLFQRLSAARDARPGLKVVTIDPRRTATADFADLHLAIAPGSDVALFNGLLSWLETEGCVDQGFVADHTTGFDATLRAARLSLEGVAALCEVEAEQIRHFYRLFAAHERTVTAYSQGVNQSSSGTDKVNAIINCHLATGRIGRPGMGPLSLTGQPNAMGGREAGGMANQLAAHMDFVPAEIDRVGRFWHSPGMAAAPGLKAVDLFGAVADGRIRALLIMGTNPAVSMPEGDRVRAALGTCPFVAVAETSRTSDTLAFAHVVLPALAWGEKDGTVTNTERRLSRQRPFLAPPGQARADWWILTRLAQLMGHGAAFAYERPADIFREHALLSGFENEGARRFDISGLAACDFETMPPVQWPAPPARPSGTARVFEDGLFSGPSGRAAFIAVSPRAPAQPVTRRYPLRLNTGRLRDQWHTMTRTGKAPTLAAHRPEPAAELHPADARRYGILDGGFVRIESAHGAMTVRARVTDAQRQGDIFVPMHWSDARARDARVGALVNAAVDPISGQPELKHTPVRVAPVHPIWHGFALSEQPLRADADYAVLIREHRGWRHALAGATIPHWPSWTAGLFGREATAELSDGVAYRAVIVEAGRLAGCVVAAPAGVRLPEPSFLAGMLGQELDAEIGQPAIRALDLLAGRSVSRNPDEGPTICACFAVGLRRIEAAIESGVRTVAEIGTLLRAGTNCGSCLPELKSALRLHACPPRG